MDDSYGERDFMVVCYFQRWAALHPHPDQPLFWRLDGSSYSPRRIAQEVMWHTPFAQAHVASLRNQAEAQGMDLFDLLDQLFFAGSDESLEGFLWRLDGLAESA